jgi:hypothetical protein
MSRSYFCEPSLFAIIKLSVSPESIVSDRLLSSRYLSFDSLPPDLRQLATLVDELARSRSGDCLALLELLRVLEELHRAIHDQPFNEALPDTRQALYNLLQDIEATGSWPYIPRLQIRALLQNLAPTDLNPGLNLPPHPSLDGKPHP